MRVDQTFQPFVQAQKKQICKNRQTSKGYFADIGSIDTDDSSIQTYFQSYDKEKFDWENKVVFAQPT